MVDKPELLNQLAGDPIQFVDILYAVIKPQLDELGIDDVAFGESLDGESVERATEALLEGLVDFFPGARKAMLQRVWRERIGITTKPSGN